jgi:hypothetical protein
MDVLIDSSGASIGIGMFLLFIEGKWQVLMQKRL